MAVPSRILVAQSAFLGDLVLSQPLVAELVRHFAPAPVDLLVRAPFVELARTMAGVAEVIPDDKGESPGGLLGLFRLKRRLAASRYALAVSPHKSFRTGLLLRMTGIPERVGFAGAPGAFFWTRKVDDPGGSYPDRLEKLLQAVGTSAGGADPLLAPTPSSQNGLEAKLSFLGIPSGARLAVLHPGSVWRTKRWIPDGYGEVAQALFARGFRVVVSGGPEDRAVADEVLLAAEGAAIDLTGRTTLPELVALAKRASLFVSGDSGPMHIAAAVGTPVIAIFGPTVPAMGFAPRSRLAVVVEKKELACRPCHRHGPKVCPLRHFRCMRDLTSGEVLAAVDRVLALRAA